MAIVTCSDIYQWLHSHPGSFLYTIVGSETLGYPKGHWWVTYSASMAISKGLHVPIGSIAAQHLTRLEDRRWYNQQVRCYGLPEIRNR